MNRVIMISVTLVFLLQNAAIYSQEIWVGKDGNIRNIDTRAILVDEEGLYLATKKEIYRASDVKDRWEAVFAVPGGENEIRCLAGRMKNIYVGTKRGLFRSQDHGGSWKNVFRTIMPEKNSILCIEVSRHNPKTVAIGTEKGVFISGDCGDKWQDISSSLRNKRIDCIALNKESMYAGGEGGLYIRKADGPGWERLYISSVPEKTGEEDTLDMPPEIEEDSRSINCIAIKNSTLYIGMDKKILYSNDAGKSWDSFPIEGLSGKINYILPSARSDKLYCATTKGVYEFDKSIWHELYKGMGKAHNIDNIAFDGESEAALWALTDKGLYRLESGKYVTDQYVDIERNLKSIKIIFDSEPAFSQLQKAALKYAELDPEKITNWRTEARLRALLPKVSFGFDKNSSSNSEIYTSATRDYVVVGPDDINNGYDISVSWELGDLVWSDDQTNIDVRSRLTTQLRNDILDDLRRAYYERKRLQFELMQAPPKDLRIRFEKEMRLQELTQAIDDLTGNYLSRNIEAKPKEELLAHDK